ncbi:hypothetical protein XM38_024500 [Halomicronema hongdechloris C2206]|uniref:Uncharacterized protein n=1 Tax=Halomicronema hongdechloris C2206 TaxID=1641165 RepID=A0A1Z3HMI9_9CYAN|nr:hypothetical protein [Halomicronema hongdechloris]ASC71498.1 hypothetical protein XM38_024500 [Halomicronema hongdechloris C2206]
MSRRHPHPGGPGAHRAPSTHLDLSAGNRDPAAVPIPNPAAIAAQRRFPRRAPQLQPGFKALIGLTLLMALLLLPFAFSAEYLALLRQNSVDLHRFLRGEAYKQATGYGALSLVILELLLTVRKRSRSWIGRIKLPGSMQVWRSVHIFLGVALVGMVLIHTIGATGMNFNAVFLWVFFASVLTALVGVVAETGILESTRRYFGRLPGSNTVLTKGPLVRGLRALWLTSHIFFVCVFGVMLVCHIILAYYYQ